MKLFTSLKFAAAAALIATSASAHGFSYDDQKAWHFESGNRQSPMAIESAGALKNTTYLPIVNHFDGAFVPQIENNGHSLNVLAKGYSDINGRRFELKGFHFHSPSEHTIDGKQYPLEIHFVHAQPNGQLAVIGVMAELGAANAEFEKVLKNVDSKNTQKINIAALLPGKKAYFSYLGGLTTPPLSEIVEWYVLKQPITISAEQLRAFNAYYKGNNRDLQPRNDRAIISVDK